jgi:hypothetical protein
MVGNIRFDPKFDGRPTPGKAIIMVDNPDADLFLAARAWEAIQTSLIQGNSVQQAVEEGITAGGIGLKIVGDKSVCIGPRCKRTH